MNRTAKRSAIKKMPKEIHVGTPNIGNKDLFTHYLNDILNRKWLTNNGPYVRKFEQKLCRFLGVKHCIPICNGTIALELAIRALELKGEVIIPAFTFIATAHSLQWQEITPVFCDVDEDDLNIDIEKIESLITPKTSAIIGVHLWGRPCNVHKLERLAKKHKLKLIFDAAHAFGCTFNGKKVGGFGNAEVFSFHATKIFNTFEGGAIATNDDHLAKKIRLMKNFGFAGYDNVVFIGTNGKMNEVSAAMGLVNLKSMRQFIQWNKRNYLLYKEKLRGLKGISLIEYNQRESNNYQYIALLLDQSKPEFNRDRLVQELHKNGILARKYFYPGCHKMEPYKSYYPNAHLVLPVTSKICHQILLLPTGASVEAKDVQRICGLIEKIVHT